MRSVSGVRGVVMLSIALAVSEVQAGRVRACRDLCHDAVTRCADEASVAAGCTAGSSCPGLRHRMTRTCRRLFEGACRRAPEVPLACGAADVTSTTSTPTTSTSTTSAVLGTTTTTIPTPGDPLCALGERSLSEFEASWTARLSVDGRGFMVFRDGARHVLALSAGIQMAADGRVLDLQGLPLQGYELDEQWRPSAALTDVDLSKVGSGVRATSRVTLALRLDPAAAVLSPFALEWGWEQVGTFSLGFRVWDGLGVARELGIVVAHVGPHRWRFSTFVTGPDLAGILLDQRTVEFDQSGSPFATNLLVDIPSIPWAGAPSSAITLNLGPVREESGDVIQYIDDDGYGASPISDLRIMPDGTVYAFLLDGRVEAPYRVGLAIVPAPARLDECGPGYLLETALSGSAQVAAPGVLGTGGVEMTGRLW